MYLSTVLQQISSDRKVYAAEDLYKLNEAIFNLPEEDHIDTKMGSRLFQAVQRVVKAYSSGSYDHSDPNFFYDYVALLATMQNQHFFTSSQNKQMLEWLQDAVGEETDPPQASTNGYTAKDIARLEAENAELAKGIEEMRELSDAITLIKTWKPVASEDKSTTKTKGKSKSKAKRRSDKKESAEEGDEAPAEEEEAAADADEGGEKEEAEE